MFESGPLTATGNLYVSNVDLMNNVTLNVVSIGSGNTITLESSTNNSTWISVSALPTITTCGVFTVDVRSFVYFRARVSTYGSGTVWINVEESDTILPLLPSNQEIIANSSLPALRITQTGTGLALIVEDADTVDGSPFVIDASGNAGVGTNTPSHPVHVVRPGVSAYIASADGVGTTLSGVNGSGLGIYGTFSNTAVAWYSNSLERVRIDAAGNVGIGTIAPSQLLDVNADSIRVRTARTPATATDTGTAGQIAWDANYVYVCVATNTWKRSAITTW